ncbi:hypothetical protein AB0M28_39975 [Streptomyces sp. NPDC051940]|uniref:hypothetical protein n=1 Tax=Streptomyces sp. NPDC051940 TaxID=3155675 RepID=UPI003429B083
MTAYAYEALLDRIADDPRIAGAVLSGSQARDGMAGEHSDHDVYLIAEDDAAPDLAGEVRRDAELDIVVMPLSEFRGHALPGCAYEWNRYAFVHARLLKDRPDGLIARLVTRKAALGPEEAANTADEAADGFANSVYRWLKNHRAGLATEARLDAAEALPPLLTYVFAVEGRVRPYNKYLGWELNRAPLDCPAWRHDRLLPLLDEVLATARPELAHGLFADFEAQARAAGQGPVLDAWGDDLLLMRGAFPQGSG